MRTVVVVAAGGTIASTADAQGVKTATVTGGQLVSVVRPPAGVAVRVVDAATVNSFAMGFTEMDLVHRAVRSALADAEVCGVVVTHGTDTLEETAMLVDLFHRDPRPVVFTGAQRSWDDRHSDAGANLRDAVAVAAAAQARDLGVLVAFGGVVHAAAGTRKVHNSALGAFFDVDNGPVGMVGDGAVRIHAKLHRPTRNLPPFATLAGVRVDTIALYPGADSTALDACVAAGAHGLVLQATGYGNANPRIAEAIGEHTAAGVRIVVSTRVSAGPVRAVYGGGGAVDLVRRGAVLADLVRPSQARILLAALLASGSDRDHIAAAFTARTHRYTDPGDPPVADARPVATEAGV